MSETATVTTTKTTKSAKDWQCQECGLLMTLAAAEKASSVGCRRCGGSDVDLRS